MPCGEKMEKLNAANKKLKTAHDDREREYRLIIQKLDECEAELLERLSKLEGKKVQMAEENGNVDAADEDVVEINAGGKVIAAMRSMLTQLKGTGLEALFSGRWDKKLQRDGRETIFLDVNPVAFQAIVDYLNELTISSEESPPVPPTVDEEHKHILTHQTELFGIADDKFPDSNIVKAMNQWARLQGWLEEGGSSGNLSLLYRSSREGCSDNTFRFMCKHKVRTLTIIETNERNIFGGYSNTAWYSNRIDPIYSNRVNTLPNVDISSPCKIKLREGANEKAVYDSYKYGPTFGDGPDMKVDGSKVSTNIGRTYIPSSSSRLNSGCYDIKEMEVFEVTCESSSLPCYLKLNSVALATAVTRFSEQINDAINTKTASLMEFELEILRLENCFKDEERLVTSFCNGDTEDVVTLNVSGTIMVTKRATLCAAKDSALAQQFDNSKWTEQGSNKLRVKEWSPDDVSAWVQTIDGIPSEVASIFKENQITGLELLALSLDGLKMIGIERAGTLCLLLKEIKSLENACQDTVTLIEHSPYCFGKILEYLRLRQLHAQGLVREPSLPSICEAQKSRFEKVVKYYFPGDSAKLVLG
ncbi:hypothetical protein ACHAWF_002836 [Thalassiosira exigua]